MRDAESRLGSVTGGNGSIYAVRRADYVEVDPRFGHDLSLPYLMVQRGRRAVYEPAAVAFEKPTPTQRDRVPAQGADVRALLADRAARPDAARPAAALPSSQLVSHRHLRYAQRAAAPRPARDDRSRSSRDGWFYDRRARRAGRCCVAAAAPASGSPATTCSSRWATLVSLSELPAPRRARDLGGGGGDPLAPVHLPTVVFLAPAAVCVLSWLGAGLARARGACWPARRCWTG